MRGRVCLQAARDRGFVEGRFAGRDGVGARVTHRAFEGVDATFGAEITICRLATAFGVGAQLGRESDAIVEHASIGRRRRRRRAGSLVGSGTRREAERDEQQAEAAHERTAYTDFSTC